MTTLPPLTREVLFYLVEQGEEGAHRWDVERAFPTRHNLTGCLERLVEAGLARVEVEPRGTTPVKRYVRTGKPVGPQAKLTVFVEVPA